MPSSTPESKQFSNDSRKDAQSQIEYPDYIIKEEQIGIWKIKSATPRRRFLLAKAELKTTLQDVKNWILICLKLVAEIYSIAPTSFVCYVLLSGLDAVEKTLRLAVSNLFLSTVEQALKNGTLDSWVILRTVLIRLAIDTISFGSSSIGARFYEDLQLKVDRYFKAIEMRRRLETDLPASQAPTPSMPKTESSETFRDFRSIMRLIRYLFSITTQLIFLRRLSQFSGEQGSGTVITFLAVVKPIYDLVMVVVRASSGRSYISVVNDENYLRSEAMVRFAYGDYRQDIVGNGLAPWIIQEYRKANEAMHKRVPGLNWSWIARTGNSLARDLRTRVLAELPIVFASLQLVFKLNGRKISGTWPRPWSWSLGPLDSSSNLLTDPTTISSIAAIQMSTSSLRDTIYFLSAQISEISGTVERIKAMYEKRDAVKRVVGGTIAYPRVGYSEEGMSFELRNVVFNYPGSQAKRPALNLASSSSEPASTTLSSITALNTLRIPSGSITVIVGTNGSGKSTLIKLLSRLYDATSGNLVIDGLDASEYDLASLKRATVLLSQDNKIYPVSLRENVELGWVERLLEDSHGDLTPESKMDVVEESVNLGGANGIVEKLYSGLDTVLDSREEWNASNLDTFGFDSPDGAVDKNENGLTGQEHAKEKKEKKREHPLAAEYKKLRRPLDLSGGEKQRVAASRAFMRLNSDHVRFVAVDEPSSALDAHAENQLFQRLIDKRKGKTMVFVTHRFGHLTKVADQIICMKDGKVVEVGKHQELICQKGEYAGLYEAQAMAFIDDSKGRNEN